MSIKFISPKKSVNSAFLKLPVPCEKMERFQTLISNGNLANAKLVLIVDAQSPISKLELIPALSTLWHPDAEEFKAVEMR